MTKRIFLVLGCNGKVDGQFVSCSKVENPILELSEKLEQIEDIIAYFKSLGLFERQMVDYNAIRRVLFNIKDKYYNKYVPIWDDKYFRLLEKFTLSHKECGMYLKIAKI